MKRFITIIILLIIIILSFGFVWLKSSAQGAENNFFNRNLRAYFAAVPWLREVLALHFDGDRKADYLGRRYKKIMIEVDLMNTKSMRLSALDILVQRIQSITGKPTSYLISDRSIPYERNLSKEQIRKLVQYYRNHKSMRETVTIYLFYASRDKDVPTRLGTTYEEYGLVLFGDALADFIKNNPETLGSYEASTALHEFGHQIGLAHNQEPSCLMNEQVEEARLVREKPEEVIIDFCEYEFSQIRNSKH